MSQVGGNFTETDPLALPLAGGTMTGAIILANVAGTITMPSAGASATLISQNATGATKSGSWTFSTGTTVSANSGGFSFTTGNVSTAGASGAFTATTGTGVGGASGAISFTTGASDSGTGSISFTVGTPTGGTRGSITGDALDYTFTSRAASAANSFVFRANSTYTGAGIFRIQDGSGAGSGGDRVHILSDSGSVTIVNILTGGSGNGLQIRSGNSPIIQPSAASGATDLQLLTQANSGATGGIIIAPGDSSGGDGLGGEIDMDAGSGNGTGNGGAVTIDGGVGGSTSGTGGAVNLTAGAAGGSGAGGAIAITTGVGGSGTGTGGLLSLVSGNGGTGTGDAGAITITSGNGSTTGTGSRGGNITITTGNGGGSAARQSGAWSVTTGTPSATGTSGGLTLQTGVGGSTSGASGAVSITTGTTTSGTSGSITLTVGTPTSGTTGDFLVAGAANFTLTGTGTPVQTLTSTDAGAGGGPDIVLYRNSASAAANDVLGRVIFDGNSATPTRRTMGVLQSVLVTATNGAEDAKIEFYTILAGASNLAVWVDQGGQINADLGAGTGNVTVFDDYDDVAMIRSMYDVDRERRERSLESMSELGLVSRKPGGSGWAMAVQPWLALLAGGVYQTADRVTALETENTMLRARINALEARIF